MNILTALKPLVYEIKPVGSRVTCNPAPTDTDEDYLIFYSPQNKIQITDLLEGEDYDHDGSMIDIETVSSDFCSYSKDDVNLIFTSDGRFYENFLLATKVCKQLNLLRKEDRVTVFQAILYGNFQ